MKKLWYMSVLLCFLATYNTQAQALLHGTVSNNLGEKLFGATILWENTTIGTVADEAGNFTLPKSDTTANLAINYVGYNPVFITVEPFEDTVLIVIDGIIDLMTVEVAADIRDNYVSLITPINVEVIGAGELRKAPCCNLAESFETNAAIDVTYSDAVTGAREIQLLGLRGTYTQMLIENRPSMGGLGSAFAMEYIPGTWLQSIQISKGTSSVLNGYQAITGQLNAELVKPFNDQPVFINLYGSTFGRGEANIHLNHEFNSRWSSGLLLHGSTRNNQQDQNGDGFYDTPQKDMLDGMLRLFYRGDVLRAQFNVHALRDQHFSGQINYDAGQIPYRINQDNDRVEFFGKAGFLGFKKPYNTLGFITNASWHQMDSYYGTTWHRGTQQNFYANLIYATIIGNTDHKLNMGSSFLYDHYDEQLNDSDFSRTERVPGIFGEYTYAIDPTKRHEGTVLTWREKLGIVAGLRVDRHNLFGWLVTPRVNVKYNFSENSVARISAGRGYRTANVIAENISMLASSRTVEVLDDLKMEDAWNFGVNFTQNFDVFGREASLALDLYRTEFHNQIIIDHELDFQKIFFYNLDGTSYANSFLAVLSYELLPGLDVKGAYKFNDVKVTYREEGLLERPLVAKHRGLVTMDYETPKKKWRFNTSLQIVGPQRFPDHTQYPARLIVDHQDYSPTYAKVGAQITRKFKDLEIYFGGENLTNYRQKNPIIDWENPFGPYFNATQIYGPITGAMGYLGLRWGFGKGKKKT